MRIAVQDAWSKSLLSFHSLGLTGPKKPWRPRFFKSETSTHFLKGQTTWLHVANKKIQSR